MDIVLEIIFDVFSELIMGLVKFLINGTSALTTSSKTPIVIRLSILSLLIGGMSFLYYLAYLNRTDGVSMGFFLILGSLILLFLLKVLREFMKKIDNEQSNV